MLEGSRQEPLQLRGMARMAIAVQAEARLLRILEVAMRGYRRHLGWMLLPSDRIPRRDCAVVLTWRKPVAAGCGGRV